VTVASPAPAFRAAALRGTRILGEIEVSIFHPSLIMDRDGVLRETAVRMAQAILASPRSGYLQGPIEIPLPIGPTWRVDVVLERDELGKVPTLPYQAAMAVGHPDLRLNAALFIMVRAAEEGWEAGFEMLESLRFSGKDASRAAGYELPLTF
jgi:hypothetical protein